VRHVGRVRPVVEEPRPHGGHGLGPQEPCVAKSAVAHQEPQEPFHVGGRAGDAAGGGKGAYVDAERRMGDPALNPVAGRKRRLIVTVPGLARRGVLHTEWTQDAGLDKVLPWEARQGLDDIPRQRNAPVRVGRHLTPRKHLLRCGSGQRLDPWQAGDGVVENGEAFLETRAVAHQLRERQRRVAGDQTLGQDRRDVVAQTDHALLDEHHDRDPGEQLGDRPDLEAGVVRAGRYLRLDIGKPVAAQDGRVARDDDRDRPGHLFALHEALCEGVQTGGEDGFVRVLRKARHWQRNHQRQGDQ
jgi:hypothetical protein